MLLLTILKNVYLLQNQSKPVWQDTENGIIQSISLTSKLRHAQTQINLLIYFHSSVGRICFYYKCILTQRSNEHTSSLHKKKKQTAILYNIHHAPFPTSQPWKQPFDLLIVLIEVFFHKIEPSSLRCPTQRSRVNAPHFQAVIKTLSLFTHPDISVADTIMWLHWISPFQLKAVFTVKCELAMIRHHNWSVIFLLASVLAWTDLIILWQLSITLDWFCLLHIFSVRLPKVTKTRSEQHRYYSMWSWKLYSIYVVCLQSYIVANSKDQ